MSQGFQDGDLNRDVDKLKETLKNHGETFPMTSFSGIEYACIVPESSGDVFTEEDKGAGRNKEKEESCSEKEEEEEEEEMSDLDAIKKKIQSMENGPCMFKSLGYWQYEVCPFRNVKQFHREGKTISMSFNLGDYVPNSEKEVELEKSDVEKSQQQVRDKKGNVITPVMSQTYAGGDADRKTVVGYVCDRMLAEGTTRIESIREGPTHVYNILVATNKACNSEDLVYSLLAPLRKQCLRKIGSWWTYEVCAGQHVRQYHKEKDGVETEHILGLYASSNARSPRASSSNKKSTNSTEEVGVLLESYMGGSICDITQEPRETIVKYRCSEMEKFSVIDSVEESASCKYTVSILTPLLCSHPEFRNTSPHTSLSLAKMHCIPKSEL